MKTTNISGIARTTLAMMAIAGAAVLSACSQIPVATTYPAESQPHMQSVAHWRSLARDLVTAIQAQRQVDPALAGKPIYVQPQRTQTAFNDGFHTFLTAELLNRGLPLALHRDAANVLKYTTQVVAHKTGRWNRPAPGLLTGAAALVAIPAHLLQFDYTSGEYAGLAIGAGAAADLLAGAITDETETELVFSASIFDGEVMRFRAVQTFYVNDKDYAHYEGFSRQTAARLVAY